MMVGGNIVWGEAGRVWEQSSIGNTRLSGTLKGSW